MTPENQRPPAVFNFFAKHSAISPQNGVNPWLCSEFFTVSRITLGEQVTSFNFGAFIDEEAWVMLLKGTASIKVNGMLYDMAEGDFIYLDCDMKHTVEKASKDAVCIAIHFE